jgi:3',5'-cyclic AMP phosphodiesterase CpdA
LRRALGIAKASRADHVVISGDLTETGEEVEFEHFAEVLHESGISPETITLVPGNHDAYTPGDAWRKAMAGPLAKFAASSADSSVNGPGAGKLVDRGKVAFFPIDTSRFQNIAWSGGIFTRAMVEALERRLHDAAFQHKALVLITHHPPFHPHRLPIVRWIDGLRGSAEVLELLGRHPRLQLLHGHLHRVLDRILMAGKLQRPESTSTPTRLFGAPATCDGPDDAPPIRFYDVRGGVLSAA